MEPLQLNRDKIIEMAVSKFGSPYRFGSKWDPSKMIAQGPVDCSGYSRWCYMQGTGLLLPEGSTNQHAMCEKTLTPKKADLAFLQDLNKNPNLGAAGADDHHVGIVYDDFFMIEARGIIFNGVEMGSVMLKSRKEWEGRPDFLGCFIVKGAA